MINNLQGQCDQIGRFFAIWSTFKSLWLHYVGPNFREIFEKWCKSFIFQVKTSLPFLGNFLLTLGDFLLKPSGHPGGHQSLHQERLKSCFWTQIRIHRQVSALSDARHFLLMESML